MKSFVDVCVSWLVVKWCGEITLWECMADGGIE